MALIFLCDFCQQPVFGDHYFFTVEQRSLMAMDDTRMGVVTGATAPLAQPLKAKAYVIHPRHFAEDAAAVAAALYSDFSVAFKEPDPAPPSNQLEATFTATVDASDPHTWTFVAAGDDTLTYEWDYGDGSTDAGVSVTHTYAAAGDYTVTFVVRDAADQTATTAQVISVVDPAPNQDPVLTPPAAVRANPRDHLS